MKQLRSLRSLQDELEKNDVAVVAVTGDPPERTKKFREREGLRFDVLTDAGGAFFQGLGVKRRGTVQGRAYAHPTTVVLDREGIARRVDVRKLLFAWRPGERKLLEVARALP